MELDATRLQEGMLFDASKPAARFCGVPKLATRSVAAREIAATVPAAANCGRYRAHAVGRRRVRRNLAVSEAWVGVAAHRDQQRLAARIESPPHGALVARVEHDHAGIRHAVVHAHGGAGVAQARVGLGDPALVAAHQALRLGVGSERAPAGELGIGHVGVEGRRGIGHARGTGR